MEMYTVPKAEVLELIETRGCRLVDAAKTRLLAQLMRAGGTASSNGS
jgi:hypothetical protein